MEKQLVEARGSCEKRFEPIRDLFQESLNNGENVGASFAATIDGQFVVDLWGGYADKAKTRPWEENTIVCVASTTKIPVSLCILMLIDRGIISPDAPVARYWPEFAQSGKEGVLVRHVLSHSSGLSGFDQKMALEDLYNWQKCVDGIATQKPRWKPGTQSAYATPNSFILGELVRRLTGKSIGTFFREEVAEPIGIEFHIGLPEALAGRGRRCRGAGDLGDRDRRGGKPERA